MQKNILLSFALLIAISTSLCAQNITITIANITNKNLTVELAQSRCASITRQLKAKDYVSIPLACPLEGINIKGIPTPISLTTTPQQDSFLLELDKTGDGVILTPFAIGGRDASGVWSGNLARAGRNLEKLTRIRTIESDPETLKIISEKEVQLKGEYDQARATAEYLRTHLFPSSAKKKQYLDGVIAAWDPEWQTVFSFSIYDPLPYELSTIYKRIEDTYQQKKNALAGMVYQQERKKLTDSLEYPN